jgi:hypothetical protein
MSTNYDYHRQFYDNQSDWTDHDSDTDMDREDDSDEDAFDPDAECPDPAENPIGNYEWMVYQTTLGPERFSSASSNSTPSGTVWTSTSTKTTSSSSSTTTLDSLFHLDGLHQRHQQEYFSFLCSNVPAAVQQDQATLERFLREK